jgi:hypothetical protein
MSGYGRPLCEVTGDHHWYGGSVCGPCGARLRCICGRFVNERDLRQHQDACPTVAAEVAS